MEQAKVQDIARKDLGHWDAGRHGTIRTLDRPSEPGNSIGQRKIYRRSVVQSKSI